MSRYGNGDFRTTVSPPAEQNISHFRYWQEAAKIDVPVMEDISPLVTQMEKAAIRLDSLFAQKQVNSTESIHGDEIEDALATWGKWPCAVHDDQCADRNLVGKYQSG